VLTPGKGLYVMQGDDSSRCRPVRGPAAGPIGGAGEIRAFVLSEAESKALHFGRSRICRNSRWRRRADARILDARDSSFRSRVRTFTKRISTRISTIDGYESGPDLCGFSSANSYFNKQESGANASIRTQGEPDGSVGTTSRGACRRGVSEFDADEGRPGRAHSLHCGRDHRGAAIFYDYSANHMKNARLSDRGLRRCRTALWRGRSYGQA